MDDLVQQPIQQKSRLPWVLGTGALLGAVLATWLAPIVIAWYFTPPAQMGFNCVEPIRWALQRLQWAELLGGIGGAILALIFYMKLRGRRGHEQIEPTV